MSRAKNAGWLAHQRTPLVVSPRATTPHLIAVSQLKARDLELVVLAVNVEVAPTLMFASAARVARMVRAADARATLPPLVAAVLPSRSANAAEALVVFVHVGLNVHAPRLRVAKPTTRLTAVPRVSAVAPRASVTALKASATAPTLPAAKKLPPRMPRAPNSDHALPLDLRYL